MRKNAKGQGRAIRKLTPVVLADVSIDDAFPAPRLGTKRRVVPADIWQILHKTRRLNRARWAWRRGQLRTFCDSDYHELYWPDHLATHGGLDSCCGSSRGSTSRQGLR